MRIMKSKKATLQILNQLIQMHHDRIAGYKLAATVLKDNDTELLQHFNDCCEESKYYIAQCADEVWQNKGKAKIRSSTLGKIFRVIMKGRCSLSSQNKSSVIALCMWGEYAMQKAYETAQYQSNEITDTAVRLINTQHSALRRNYLHQKEHYHSPILA